ncbi:MFS transporter [Brachybacterium sp. ACRRE]|uniref:MFS transporter n=1 Tax=Brachybacterium sp. ACRRE TaxID=2918184 RepID=UPI001EF1BED4|nr:MFS transporter [Brachybacterium sp. ACRRE]MCG7310947.1 MFS transporter [Brachybacterium sp. ACRRE]
MSCSTASASHAAAVADSPAAPDVPAPPESTEPTSPPLGAGGVVLLAAAITGNLIFGSSTLALPALEDGLGLTASTGTLVVALFSVGFASSLVLGGRLGDAWGRRRMLQIALAALVPASLLVALAPGAGVLLVGRVLQGVASGLALPQVLSTIQHTTVGRSRARWTGAYASVIGGGTAIGQIGAGALVAADPWGAGWRLAFGFVALVAALALFAARAIPETSSSRVSRLDPLGALLLGAAIAAIVLPLGAGSLLATSAVVSLLVLAAVLLAAFALWQRHRTDAHALVPLSALRVRPLQLGLALTLVFFASYGGFVYYFSTTLQTGLHLGALTTAIVLTVFAAGFVVTSAMLPALVARWTPRHVMLAGVAGQAVMLAATAAIVVGSDGHPSLVLLCLVLVVLGVAQAAMYGPLIGSVMGAVSHDLAGLASGLFSTLQQVGIALGVPVFGLVLGALPTYPALAVAACIGVQILFAAVFAVLVTALGRATNRGSSLTASKQRIER